MRPARTLLLECCDALWRANGHRLDRQALFHLEAEQPLDYQVHDLVRVMKINNCGDSGPLRIVSARPGFKDGARIVHLDQLLELNYGLLLSRLGWIDLFLADCGSPGTLISPFLVILVMTCCTGTS